MGFRCLTRTRRATLEWANYDTVRNKGLKEPTPLPSFPKKNITNQTLMLLMLVLTNLGEKMTDEEVDELLKAVDTSSGEINYMGKQAIHLKTSPCFLQHSRNAPAC